MTTLREANVANDVIWTGGGGIIERRTWDNDLVWSYTLNDSLYRLHHDIQVMDNGNVLALVWELKDSLEYVAAGGDMSMIDDVLWSEVVFELEPNGSGGADVVWEWHAWDHLVQDFDENKPNYGVIADNPQKINLNSNSPQGQQPLADWLHMNSIHFNPVFGQIMVSVPNLNEVWIIDYAGGAEKEASSGAGAIRGIRSRYSRRPKALLPTRRSLGTQALACRTPTLARSPCSTIVFPMQRLLGATTARRLSSNPFTTSTRTNTPWTSPRARSCLWTSTRCA